MTAAHDRTPAEAAADTTAGAGRAPTAGPALTRNASRAPAHVHDADAARAWRTASLLGTLASAFGAPLRSATVVVDETAASALRPHGARGLVRDGRILLDPARYDPGTVEGRRLLTHEAVHLVQQSRPATGTPLARLARAAPDRLRAAEVEAARLGALLETGHRPGPPVVPLTHHEIARDNGPRSRFESLAIRRISYTELMDEIHAIERWFDDHPVSNVENDHLMEVLEALVTERRRRDRQAQEPRRRRRRRARAEPQPVEEPESLRASLDVEQLPEIEVAAELDRIMAYLESGAGSREDRSALQPVVRRLQRRLGIEQARRDDQVRRDRITAALTPRVEGDAREQMAAVMRVLEGIRPDSTRPGVYLIFHGGRAVPLTAQERDGIVAGVLQELQRSARRLGGQADYYRDRFDSQRGINESQRVVAFIVEAFNDVDAPSEQLVRAQHRRAQRAARRVRAHAAAGEFVAAGEALAELEEAVATLRARVMAWIDGLISTAEGAVTVLEITRDTAFAISISIGAVVAAPALVAGGATALQAGVIVTGGGALAGGTLRGGGNVLGQLATGEEVHWETALAETGAGARAGAVDASTAALGLGLRGVVGAGQRATRLGNAGRALVAEGAAGATGETTRAVLEGRSTEEVLRAGGMGLLSGGIGGGSGEIVSGLTPSASPLVRGLATGGAGSATAVGVTALSGGDRDEFLRAGITGFVSGALPVAADQPRARAPRPTGEPTPETPQSAGRRAEPGDAGEHLAARLGDTPAEATSAPLPGPEPTGGSTAAPRTSGAPDAETVPRSPRPRDEEGGEPPRDVEEPLPGEATRPDARRPDVPEDIPWATLEQLDGMVMQGPNPRSQADAYTMYGNAVAEHPNAEVAVYRNTETGEYLVVQGHAGTAETPPSVAPHGEGRPSPGGRPAAWKEILDRGSDRGRWELDAHSHPGRGPGGRPTELDLLPSGGDGDFGVLVHEAMEAGGVARTSRIHARVDEQGYAHTDYGVDPRHPEPFWIDRPLAGGGRQQRRFRSLESFHEFMEGLGFRMGPVPESLAAGRWRELPVVPGEGAATRPRAATPPEGAPALRELVEPGGRFVTDEPGPQLERLYREYAERVRADGREPRDRITWARHQRRASRAGRLLEEHLAADWRQRARGRARSERGVYEVHVDERMVERIRECPHQDLVPLPELEPGDVVLIGESSRGLTGDAAYMRFLDDLPHMDLPPDLLAEFQLAQADPSARTLPNGERWPMQGTQPWELHHVHELSLGGGDLPYNLLAIPPSVHADLTAFWSRFRQDFLPRHEAPADEQTTVVGR